METIEYHGIVDKSKWPDHGEWNDEPDKVQWPDETTGLPCLIVRGPPGALCGYVGVPVGHPWHGVDYDSCRMFEVPEGEYDPDSYPSVHGGLTFAAGCSHGADPARGICHVPGPGEPDDVWWLGFDCAHAGDLTPRYESLREVRCSDVYRDIEYVRAEVRGLAKQAAQVASEGVAR